jgi:hypothetical protein
LIKNSLSKPQLLKPSYKPHNFSDKKQEFTSPKFIKRNNSETYKSNNNKSKNGESSQLQYENSKSPNAMQKLKSENNYSLEKKSEGSYSTKIRVSSAKTSTLSPAKSNHSILAKSSTFKPSEIYQSDIKIKNFDDLKNLAKIQTISANSVGITHSNSSRVKKNSEEKFKESKNMIKII